ncbi:MAG: hypothetical protein GXY74_01490 [Phycisphaerae bacterium]|jgi:hypothetical protein|nr:hypothetical protein [Phycisphaerae bacterium]
MSAEQDRRRIDCLAKSLSAALIRLSRYESLAHHNMDLVLVLPAEKCHTVLWIDSVAEREQSCI